ncbi:MAG: hypothetical protein QOF60_1055 [Actinomycetota bacterium]|nr:hypothetical protein [Actinomycetota bacterium]
MSGRRCRRTFGPFEIPGLVDAWVSDPAGSTDRRFVGNVIVLSGSRQAALDRIREHYGGRVCVLERDGPTAAELEAVPNEVIDSDAEAVLGKIQEGHVDERRGVVVTTVWVADRTPVDYAERRWGGQVELRGLLRPIG